ncbi:MAG: ATP-dependent DNA helicase RecG [Candidatus Doudnabacteria bacterium]|nr:ATP-dependent DNA helicase RecG [Candidatus Doudnabacteria bacterium]
MFELSTPVQNLYLVGPQRAKLLKNLGIETLEDLLFYLPRNHLDLSKFTPIAELKVNEWANVKARVLSATSFRTKVRRLTMTQALIEDDTGSITCVWFNQPFLSKIIKQGENFIFSGKVSLRRNSAKNGSASGGKLQFQNPIYEIEKQEQIHTARLVPIYSLTAKLTQKQLRTIIKTYLDKAVIPEYLPPQILKTEKLFPEDQAVKTFHFPSDLTKLKQARNRLAFDEIFQTQTKVLQHKKIRQLQSSYQIQTKNLLDQKIRSLPFNLTDSQKQALKDIFSDFSKPYPANRLLEGDVGSGKTIIAALSMLLAAKNGLQSALLSPTEVLANQHYLTLLKLFLDDGINTGLLTSSSTKINGNPVSRQTMLAQISGGQTRLILGTHALLEKTVQFKNLSLVVIDEQHRFGVQQRSTLKQTSRAHLITMSATPIPRTLALTLYGDLDITLLNQLPTGRLPVKTKFVPEAKRADAYQFIKKQINDGRQAFVICPLIEESDKLGVKSATAEYEKLSKQVFPELKIGLLHGKIPAKDKESVMLEFKENKINILVATSVVEVGVDVPNATVMMIEGAERFGLAQLHQFRGRVGRLHHQSYCFLFSEDPNAGTNPRIQALVSSNNGFELAEKDLEIRGAGDLYGTQQSGYSFKIANMTNLDLVARSKLLAQQLLEQDLMLTDHPLLAEKIKKHGVIHLE